MLAVELRASMAWARLMRGTMSMLRPVTPAFRRASRRPGLARGWRKVMSVAPGRIAPSSSTLGSLTAMTMSLPHTVPVSASSAPAAM